MDDETDHLLEQFLVAASGERTDETRERYRRTLRRLREPGAGEDAAGPGRRLLLRIPDALRRAEAGEFEDDEKSTAPSLWLRLMTWLRWHTDAAEAESGRALREARACLQEAQRARYEERYPSPYHSSYVADLAVEDFPQREDDEDWADVLALHRSQSR